MGAQKLLMRFRGRPMIEYAVQAARKWKPFVVAGPEVAAYLRGADASVVVNEAPERGMTHSLALANEAISEDAPLIVLLGDKPLVTGALIEAVHEAMGGADVAFPVHAKTQQPGHPVIFSMRARQKIKNLSDGDSLQQLRDDPDLSRVVLLTEDPGAFFDVDTPPALEC